MKMFLLSDNIDTAIGLRLAGIDAKVVHTKDEVSDALDEVIANKEIGIVLMTAMLSELLKERVTEHINQNTKPVILVIPDRHGKTADSGNNIMATTLGIK